MAPEAPTVTPFGLRRSAPVEPASPAGLDALYGSPADMIEQLEPYIARGLDKFVLWPVAEPEAWAGQVELIGREVATHYARLARAA